MTKKYSVGKITWVDILNPTKDDIENVLDEFSLHPKLAESILLPSPRAEIDVDGNTIYTALHFPVFKHSRITDINFFQEIDFVLTENTLLTVRFEPIDAFDKFSKELDFFIETKQDSYIHFGETPFTLMYHLMRKLYKSVEHELEYITTKHLQIEAEVFDGYPHQKIQEISNIGRVLDSFKRTLIHQEYTYSEFYDLYMSLFKGQDVIMLDNLWKRFKQVQSEVDVSLSSLLQLRQTNDMLLVARQNEITKNLTIISFLALPLTLLAGIFGMNSEYTPIVGTVYDFWQIIGLMCVCIVVMIVYFRHKNWI